MRYSSLRSSNLIDPFIDVNLVLTPVLQEVWLLVFFLSLLHTTLSQCTPFDDLTCTVSECLRCDNIPASCTYHDNTLECQVNTSQCSTQTCDEQQVTARTNQFFCSFDYFVNGNEWTLASSCFPFEEHSVCSRTNDCGVGHSSGGGIRIDCCCFEDDCFNGTSEVLRVASSTGMPVCVCVCVLH